MEFAKRNHFLWVALKVVAITAFVMILFPMVLNFLYFWESGWVRGKTGDWISFFGNYFGAIIGGLVAYFVAKQQTDQLERKWEVDELTEKDRIEGIIYTFLLDEIKENFKRIQADRLHKFLVSSNDQPPEIKVSFHGMLSFDEFVQIKYELVRYNHQYEITKILWFYRMFTLLNRHENPSMMPYPDYQFVQMHYKELIEFLKKY